MPSARRSDRDGHAEELTRELTLLVKALAHNELSGDDFYQAFQEIDRHATGYLTSKSDVIAVICDAIATKYQRRLNFDVISKAFRTKHGRFDYTAFCEAVERHRQSCLTRAARRLDSPTKSPNREPLKSPSPLRPRSPQKRSNWLMDHHAIDETPRDNRDSSGLHKMRVDPRLETQRLLSQSIRRKLLHGVVGAQSDGFRGIQELLVHLDETGAGYLDTTVFDRELLRRLKKPLTKQETQFLLANVRVRPGIDTKSDGHVHYEHLATFCNLDSDASADETTEDEARQTYAPSLSPPRSPPMRTPVIDREAQALGADFLAAEKRLRVFFQQPMASPDGPSGKSSSVDTPRSIVTGAELFLERAEAIDTAKTGFLSEHDFDSLFTTSELDISPGLVRAMLTRFPRSSDLQINYRAFLERYGENPQLARERRQLKRVLSTVLMAFKSRDVTEWLQVVTQRLEKYDARLHKRCRGDVPTEHFIRALCGPSSSSKSLKLSVDAASEILTQFLRISRASSSSVVAYNEFLRLLHDCHAQSFEPEGETIPPLALPAPAAPSTATPFAVTNVADYLIHEASPDERQHFEELMEALHKFQKRIITRATKPTGRGDSLSPNFTTDSSWGTAETLKPGASNQEKEETATPPQVGTITPVENGIIVALGAKLHVRIQFTTAD